MKSCVFLIFLTIGYVDSIVFTTWIFVETALIPTSTLGKKKLRVFFDSLQLLPANSISLILVRGVGCICAMSTNGVCSATSVLVHRDERTSLNHYDGSFRRDRDAQTCSK